MHHTHVSFVFKKKSLLYLYQIPVANYHCVVNGDIARMQYEIYISHMWHIIHSIL